LGLVKCKRVHPGHNAADGKVSAAGVRRAEFQSSWMIPDPFCISPVCDVMVDSETVW
jgi:hypothetical protein